MSIRPGMHVKTVWNGVNNRRWRSPAGRGCGIWQVWVAEATSTLPYLSVSSVFPRILRSGAHLYPAQPGGSAVVSALDQLEPISGDAVASPCWAGFERFRGLPPRTDALDRLLSGSHFSRFASERVDRVFKLRVATKAAGKARGRSAVPATALCCRIEGPQRVKQEQEWKRGS